MTTVQKEVQRAGLRAMMTESMLGAPDYAADPKVLSGVGNVIGDSASHDERHVRASDSLPKSTSRVEPPQHLHSRPSVWLLSASLGTLLYTVGLLGVLAYWHFA